MTTPACLFGAGALGHIWAVTCFGHAPGENNTESILAQVNYGADAVRMLDEHQGPAGHVYELIARGKHGTKWTRRSRAYALLDQAPDRPYEPAVEERAP